MVTKANAAGGHTRRQYYDVEDDGFTLIANDVVTRDGILLGQMKTPIKSTALLIITFINIMMILTEPVASFAFLSTAKTKYPSLSTAALSPFTQNSIQTMQHTIACSRTRTTLLLDSSSHRNDSYPQEEGRRSFIYKSLATSVLIGCATRTATIITSPFGGDSSLTTSANAMETSAASSSSSSSSPLPSSSLSSSPSINTTASSTRTTTTTVPLEFIPALGGYVVHFYLFGERFGAVLDTGSPFLTVPFRCNKFAYKYRWGCYRPERTLDSGYTNTVEAFDNNEGTVVWRKAAFSFAPSTNENTSTGDEKGQTLLDDDKKEDFVVFGVLDEAIMDGPGGVFFGLIKDTDKWIRPSFLGQMGYTSFCVDLRRSRLRDGDEDSKNAMDSESYSEPKLVLSKESLIDSKNDDYIPLVRDLNRRYNSPVVHYTARASRFVVNGLPLKLNDNRPPTYVIFDTGVTGMVVSQELFDGRYLQARKNREKSLWGLVTVAFETHNGNTVELSATKPVTTPLGKFAGFKGNLIVLGLAFLDGRAMTIDIDGDKLRFDE